MAMILFYERINWENYPSVITPINEFNLNKLDYAAKTLDERTVQLDTTKAEKETVLNTIQDWSMDEKTGIITITKVNGEQILFDLNIEKIPISFELSEDGVLSMTTDDGTVFTANIGEMIPVVAFNSTDTISVIVNGEGKNKTYSFEVKDGSITENKLQPNFLADVKTESEKAQVSSSSASESATSANTFAQQAKQYRDEAKQFRDEAETSATNAKTSEDKAKVSETNAKVSETNAKISEENAQRVAESLPEDYTDLSKAFYNTAIKQKAVGDNIHVTDSAEAKNIEFGLYGKAKQDGEPTPDNPIEITVSGSDGSVEVVSCGKNLLQNTAVSKTSNGITYTINDDGSITINGTATSNAVLDINPKVILEEGRQYVASCEGSREYNPNTEFWWFLYDNTEQKDIANVKTPSFTFNGNDFLVRVYVRKDAVINNLTVYPMIRLASDTDDTYEPYTETTSTIPTPDGLCGIKVSSGGNYTDENGQQWVCDEIVKYADGSGKRIQRIGKAVFDGSDDEGWAASESLTRRYTIKISTCKALSNLICSHAIGYVTNDNITGIGKCVINKSQVYYINTNIASLVDFKTWLASNNMTVYYELATPVITDLTAEEIAEIEKLYTFYPVTNISNDAECGMSITYMADAKNYIDNRLALIESAMLNNI